MDTDQQLEQRIDQWRAALSRHPSVQPADVDELEDHLRSQVEALEEAGLDDDEAFLVAVKRMGQLHSIAQEFALEYSERLWKQFATSPAADGDMQGSRNEPVVVILLAVVAATAIKIPELFGIHFGEDTNIPFYARNFSLFVLPFLAGYFAWKRGLDHLTILGIAAPFVAAVFIVNLMPFVPQGDTEILTVIHLPIALWLVVGVAYTGGRWRDHEPRLNFVRFSGEWFIYYALIAFGGGVLMMFFLFIFESIGLDTSEIAATLLIPCGVMGAVLIGAWLVEAKQSIIENMAPVLTRLFTPLFVILLLSFLMTMLFSGKGIDVEREVLIGFDLLLVVVLGLLLYSISARDTQASPNLFDLLQLVLVVSALLVDAFALWAIAARISEFGFSPNKIAALGLNIILLVNLGWTAVLLFRFIRQNRRRTDGDRPPMSSAFHRIEHWQTAYLPVYAAWAAVVVVLFPMVFGYQ